MREKKYIFGYHTVSSALSVIPKDTHVIYLQDNLHDKRLEKIVSLAREERILVKKISRKELDALLPPMSTHQGVVAEVEYSGIYYEDHLKTILDKKGNDVLFLILDGVQDPHNLGACLRSANASGVDAVIVPKMHIESRGKCLIFILLPLAS